METMSLPDFCSGALSHEAEAACKRQKRMLPESSLPLLPFEVAPCPTYA